METHRTKQPSSSMQKEVGVSTEYQTSKRSDVHFDMIAQSLTRMRATYHSSHDPTIERQSMSRSHAQGGSKYKLVVAEKATVEAALRQLFEGKADW